MHTQCFGYVEDELSKAVAQKLLEHRNSSAKHDVEFVIGFPNVMGGISEVQNKALTLQKAASNIPFIVFVDLDDEECAPTLIRDWFDLEQEIRLPRKLLFRVAVRETEAWVMADRTALASFLNIPVTNFPTNPDGLADPKQSLLNIIARKGRTKRHKSMLPKGPSANIGPEYNSELCRFVENHWNPEIAANNSPSLAKAINALESFHP